MSVSGAPDVRWSTALGSFAGVVYRLACELIEPLDCVERWSVALERENEVRLRVRYRVGDGDMQKGSAAWTTLGIVNDGEWAALYGVRRLAKQLAASQEMDAHHRRVCAAWRKYADEQGA